jgi:hypothetical protein
VGHNLRPQSALGSISKAVPALAYQRGGTGTPGPTQGKGKVKYNAVRSGVKTPAKKQ